MKKSMQLDETKRLMAALGRMPPKPHEEMKLRKSSGKTKTSPAKTAKKSGRKS